MFSKWCLNHQTAWKITQYITEMIALDNHIFLLWMTSGVCIIKELGLRYTILSNIFTKVPIPDVLKQVKKAMGNLHSLIFKAIHGLRWLKTPAWQHSTFIQISAEWSCSKLPIMLSILERILLFYLQHAQMLE